MFSRLGLMLFLTVAGCGRPPLPATAEPTAACMTDSQCNEGQLCDNKIGRCTDVDVNDLSTWPAPVTSDALLSRLGLISLTASSTSTPTVVAQLVDDQGATAPFTRGLASASMHVQSTTAGVQLWDLQIASSLPTDLPATNPNATLRVYDMTLTGTTTVEAPLTVATYPASSVTTTLSLDVVVKVGVDLQHLIPLTVHVDDVPATLSFNLASLNVASSNVASSNVASDALVATLTIGGGATTFSLASAYTVEQLSVTVSLIGSTVPADWMPQSGNLQPQ